MNYKIGQIGYGFVGAALAKSFEGRGVKTTVYDKYKDMGKIEDLIDCDIIFLCLPTPYVAGHGFDLGPIIESISNLKKIGYQNTISIKSTVEPGTCQKLSDRFKINVIHNPEFLTARTAFEDFDSQTHIVLGYSNIYSYFDPKSTTIYKLYKNLYPDAKISVCTSEESESMKLFVNNFYAVKVQIFNEFYFLCQKTGADFETVKKMMLENGWINPMHTEIPGHDGQPSYGGACFPKDTNALNHFMKTLGSPNKVLEACIQERNDMREEK